MIRRVDNMLKITGEGRKAALDMRLVDPFARSRRETKTDLAVDRIVSIWQATQSARCTQLVFCDLSTPDPATVQCLRRSSVRSLIRAGIPAGEIAFIHDADSDARRSMLFDAVNAGRIRILIGSTEKMGAGTNVQRRLVALHHLDAPWRPRDIEQREGRILRQGNANTEVQIYRYVTEGSFDAYMWQTLETKARFIQQVMRGELRCARRRISTAARSPTPKSRRSHRAIRPSLKKVKIDTEIRKLDQLRAVHANQQRHIRWEIRDLPRQITEARQHLARIEADIATRNANDSDEFVMKVGNRVFSGKGAREEAAEGSHAHNPHLARRSNDAAARFVQGLRGIKQREGCRIWTLQDDERIPDVLVRGRATYSANLNASNPSAPCRASSTL